MTSIGMILLDCYCGADLYYVGDGDSGAPPVEVLQRFKSQLGQGDIGFFTSADGKYGECPFCGLVYELPDPELLEWLPFMDNNNFTSTLTEIQQSGLKELNRPSNQFIDSRYLS